MTEELSHTVFKTTAGWVGLLGSGAGLRLITLPQNSEAEAEKTLGVNGIPALSSPGKFQSLKERLQAYYEGQRVDFNDTLDLYGSTDFQRAVWEATRLIPYGETRSYAWIAEKTGKPKAQRAAGQALHRNPLPIIVPCHRVIASDGSLRGFGGGVEMKGFLLRLESKR
jgi:methylated-DNA-[protein]-cysteine S-methyltransferase